MKKPVPLFFVVMAVVSATGGCAKPTPTPTDIAVAGGAEIGKTIQAQDFEITLLDAPEKLTRVGNEIVGTKRYSYDADGIFVIAPIRLTNDSGEIRMLPGSLLKVRDAQGREFPLEQVYHHLGYIWNDERWMDAKLHQLPQYPMDPGISREGPIIFDVPEDAEGLVMTAEGAEDTIALGF